MTETTCSFHVVCRQCRTERLLDSAAEAKRVADDHAAKTGHVVVYDRID